MDQLLFLIVDQVDDAVRTAVVRGISELALRRSWIAGAPAFVEDVDGLDASGFGGVLSYPSAGTISKDDDRRCLAEAEDFVGLAQRISSQFALTIEFELNGEAIGVIERGVLDRSLRDGLLGEWRAALA